MKITELEVTNFCSYPKFSINLDNLGLSLLYGKTGSGKSTVMDMSCWVLFGVTAKDGAADDVRSWQTPNAPTVGQIKVELPGEAITITRIRGRSNQNDLYFTENESNEPHRGKDATETQKIINSKLGIDADTYITGAYFHEFSPTASFFVDKAKDRRALFEKIANLELPKKLAETSSAKRKEVKNLVESKELEYHRLLGTLDSVSKRVPFIERNLAHWEDTKLLNINRIQSLADNFEEDQVKKVISIENTIIAKNNDIDKLIETIENTKIKPDNYFDKQLDSLTHVNHDDKICTACGQTVLQTEKVQELEKKRRDIERARTANVILKTQKENNIRKLQELGNIIKEYESQIEVEKQKINPYVDQIEQEKQRLNPYEADLVKLKKELDDTKAIELQIRNQLQNLKNTLTSLNILYDLTSDLRAELLNNAVVLMEKSTNGILEKYFDSEISVQFSLSGDSLNVAIQKSGYECNFKQLSKGQRQLLKLAFVVSVMKAASNKSGVQFETVFFDEALDGLDETLKIKAFNLFQELEQEHASVLLIDHAQAFQNMFTRKFHVTMAGDISSVEEEIE
jgi:DNA repair exonuclease SbcCD ATPase subunit